MIDSTNEKLVFAPEELLDEPRRGRGQPPRRPWQLLIVDDEPGVHDVTQLALADFEFEGRSLEFLHAASAAEAKGLLHQIPDIAVALIDVVMETEHSGLDLIRHIREERGDQLMRIILRTGQPGQAPERAVIRDYDINDYKEKTELTAQKLFSAVYASLRSYRDLLALEGNRQGLERVINASAEVFKMQQLKSFIQGALEQLVAVLHLGEDSMYVVRDSIALEQKSNKASILAATGRYAALVGEDPGQVLPGDARKMIQQTLASRASAIGDHCYTAYFCPTQGQDDVLYFTTERPLSRDDFGLIKLFCQNVAIAYKNVLLHRDVEETQREIVYMLGEAIETRSRETGSHVRRVAEYSRLLGILSGLNEYESDLISLASPLHDVGKIGIPDDVLHKTGKLTAEEWDVMKQHAPIGEKLLSKSSRDVVKAAAIIAGQHHERWDGSGYPSGLQGEDIHLYGRIVALADVYDALGSRRSYKEPWPQDKIVDYLQEQRGQQFDAELVDLLLDNVELFLEIRKRYPD